MATSSLGRLTLDLAVRLSEFTDGMSRAERETADRTQRMQESVTSFREHLASELGGTQLGFLSRLCGGESNLFDLVISHLFLSRLCGGECREIHSLILLEFLSRLCGGECFTC